MNGPPSEGPVDDDEATFAPRTPKDHGSISTDGNEGVPAAEDRDRDEGGDEKLDNDEVLYDGAGGYPQTSAAILTAARADGNTFGFDPPVFRKGDLVRLSNEQKLGRLGRIREGLARIIKVTTLPPDDDERAGDGPIMMYGIEYVLGGKLFNLERHDLSYTTATAEGLVDASDSSGHLLRRRRSAAASGDTEDKEVDGPIVKKSKATTKRAASGVDTPPSNRKPGRPPGSKNKSSMSDGVLADDGVVKNGKTSKKVKKHASAPAKKRKRTSGANEDEGETGIFETRSKASFAGWETRRAKTDGAKADVPNKSGGRKKVIGGSGGGKANRKTSNRGYKRSLTNETIESDANSTITPTTEASGRVSLYAKHRKEIENALVRLEKSDRFAFFLEATPPQFDENYGPDDDNDSLLEAVPKPRKAVSFPEHPPYNLLVVRKRLAAGMYDTDMVALEMERLRGIKATMNTPEMSHDESGVANNYNVEYVELERSMCHPIIVDWEKFKADVVAMCDAATIRDPEGFSLGSGHLGWAANKVKKVMEEMYNRYGNKRRVEVEESEAREKYSKVLMSCGNMEAAMQGKWRTQAFPERKYERLESSSVICDGLSPNDRSYAMYELETKLPDSFVGLAYTYDDNGQHSETWMKTVADETSKPQKTKKRKNEESDVPDLLEIKSETKAEKAAMALAKDDGVVRAQVQTAMTTLLIQVQDRVMTDLGVMHSPEARSANWDDGDHGRDYRGGGAEVEQGTRSGYSPPEVAEQEVWGIDCYTRRNIMTLIESEYSPEIAIEFVTKWLLPAINACPVDLAHKMSTAARILEGLDVSSTVERDPILHDDVTSAADHADSMSKDLSSPSDPKVSSRQSVFLRNALETKIREHAPPWIKSVARLVRLASDSMDDDYFRIHPKGHGSVVIGEGGLKANSLVTYYRGEVYPAWRWCEKLDAIELVQKELNLRPNLPDFYNMAMERPKKDPRGYCLLFVDASRKSGLGSSFSHSCNPTCEVRVVSLYGKLSLSMTTLRDLEQGEELTFDYNAVTESLNEYRFAVCLCGQKNCRGSFLHYATADCYQQVLSRNSPPAARFASLVRGCMKQVMSKEDSELLLKHGFNTAAFGAVSFNHHVSSADPQTSPDSIENVPVWLRTFVADCLRYIEYERRALPVALLCNQMERLEQKEKKKKVSRPRKEDPDTSTEASSKSKSVLSKPLTSYFFYLQSQRGAWEAIAKKDHGDLKGLEFSRAVNKIASQAWSNLGDVEKEQWKNKAIRHWKRNAGKVKAKLGEEKQQATKSKEAAKNTDTQKVEAKTKETIHIEEKDTSSNYDGTMEAKTISIADADAEGFSAMEQRIQQLAQSLSRIGRVLDRHRESVFAERKDDIGTVDCDLLRNLVPTPLKIMSDDDVVSWIWSDSKGVVPNMFSMVDQHFSENSMLRGMLNNTKRSFPVLTAYTQKLAAPSNERKLKHSCSSTDARRLVQEALLNFRMNIIDFLSFAEKSYEDVLSRKRKEKRKQHDESLDSHLEEETQPILNENIAPPQGRDDDDNPMETNTDAASIYVDTSLTDNDLVSSGDNEAIAMRGGGGECAATDPSSNDTDSLIDVKNNLLLPPSMGEMSAFVSQESYLVGPKSGLPLIQSAVYEDVQSLLHLSQVSNKASNSFQPCTEGTIELVEGKTQEEVGTISSSQLQDLINSTSSNGCDGVQSNANANTASTDPPFALNEVPPSAFLSESPQEQPKTETQKKLKKKTIPLLPYQKTYLCNWLFNPAHVLNPYPTEEERSTMMKDTGLERSRLDSWLVKNRQKVLNPEVEPMKMNWNDQDQDHWTDFRKNRYMLEATADLLLMYARTNTFFLLEPFRQFDSTPIEVYARELGNEVPRHLSLNYEKRCSTTLYDEVALSQNSTCEALEANCTNTSTKITQAQESDNHCSPDDVIDKVTVGYAGDYVLSQLLQWVNGGIGQKKGLPDIYGCVMLPPIKGCWDEIECNEVKLPDFTKGNRKKATEYHSKARPKLAKWFADRYQRGSPWDQEVAKYFCPLDQSAPDPSLPMGSPVLDYLVTGNDANIRHVSASLSGHSSTTERGGSKMSASDRLQITVDEGMPAQAVANWVQCENPKCLKWRKLPWHVDVDLLPEAFFCKDNIWNPKSQSCDAQEDEWDMDDAPIKFDSHEELNIGAWFDVQREGKLGYHEAQVIELDLESNIRRVKFHFWKLPSDRDEWVEIGSPRIAPHHSYTPRPADGYGAKRKKSSDGNKVSVDHCTTSSLPQKRMIEDAEVPIPSVGADVVEHNKTLFSLFPKSTIDYLNAWMSQHADSPFPSSSQKAQIVADTGLNKRQVGDWLARARRKLNGKLSKPNGSLAEESARPAFVHSTDVRLVKSLPSDATNAENLHLELGDHPMLLQNAQGNTALAAVQQSSHADVSTGKLGISSLIAELESDKQKISTKELDLYMKAWRLRPENMNKLYPSWAEKEKIITDTGVDKRRLEGWFSRARMKLKKQSTEPMIHSVVSQPSALITSTAVMIKADAPNVGTSQTMQPAVAIFKDDLNHSLTPIDMSSIHGSSADNRVPNSSISTGQASVRILTAKAIAEQAFSPPLTTLASTEKQTLNDSRNYALNENNPASTMVAAKQSDGVKLPSSSSPKIGFTEEAKTHLSRWMSERSQNPYPTKEEKVAMMRHLGISDEKKLDGWFCRARKRQLKNNGSSNNPAKDDKSEEVLNQGNHSHSLEPSGLDRAGRNDLIQTDRYVGSTSIAPTQGLSNFASLLSAASLINTDTGNASNGRLDDHTAHVSENSQQQIPMSLHATQNGLAPSHSENPKVGPEEQAIFSTFQILQSMEIIDRPFRASPTDRLPYPQPQQSFSSDHSIYHNSLIHHRSTPAEYMHPEYSSDFSSYQYSQDQRSSTDPMDHLSNQTSQIQARASPAGYAHQYLQGQERASFMENPHYQRLEEQRQDRSYRHPVPVCEEISNGFHPLSDDYYSESNQTSQIQARASPAEYAHQYPQGQERASLMENPHYQRLEEQRQDRSYRYPAPVCEEMTNGFHPRSDYYYSESNQTSQSRHELLLQNMLTNTRKAKSELL